MARPTFPAGIILPVDCIWRIREEQEAYDRDPAAYERLMRQREETAEEERRRAEEWREAWDG